MTAAAVGLVLDSLDDIHCLLEARPASSLSEADVDDDADSLWSVLCDPQLRRLLELYDRINTNAPRWIYHIFVAMLVPSSTMC